MMNSHSDTDKVYAEVYESKEFKAFVESIPFYKLCKFILTPNISIYVEKVNNMSYIDIFGKTRNDVSLNLIIEDKTKNIYTNIDSVDFND